MVQRIDVLMPTQSQYGVMHHFTRKIYEALLRLGYDCRLLEGEDRISVLCKDPPDLTIAMNGELKVSSEISLCDLIERPHLAILIDPSYRFFSLLQSPYMIIACNDRYSCEVLNQLNFQNTLFIPHAVERDLSAEYDQEPIYDVFMLATFIDFEARRSTWPKLFPETIVTAMEHAVEITLSDPGTSFVLAFHHSFNEVLRKGKIIDPVQVDFVRIFEQLEMYIRGKDRADLVASIHDAQVHVIESTLGGASWKSYLGGDHPNIVFHEPVTYEENLEILKKTKIVLNSSPHIKEGAHERIFNGLLCGALPITNENIYMRERFQDGENILFYRHKEMDKVNGHINEYLADEAKRRLVVANGREIVLKGHTWDHRMSLMMKDLEPILERIARNTACR